WTKRDHAAEWKQWVSWLDHIHQRVSSIPGVTGSVFETKELSTHSPVLNIRWDGGALGITGEEIADRLFNTEPRISLSAGGRRRGGSDGETGVSITAHMMQPGDDRTVADRLHAELSNVKKSAPAPPAPPAADLTGEWNVRVEYLSSMSEHTLFLRQESGRIVGTHQGDFVSRDLYGSIDGDHVKFASQVGESHGFALSYRFTGLIQGSSQGNSMSGDLDLGEYRTAKWSATRHQFRRA
ncbi:MAG: hypothetical protein ACREH9_13220, partial [Pseudomonadota bacterium]